MKKNIVGNISNFSNMDKKLKLFVACCAMAMAVVCSTTEMRAVASRQTDDETTLTKEKGRQLSGMCVGNGYCGVTVRGTKLVGKWVE